MFPEPQPFDLDKLREALETIRAMGCVVVCWQPDELRGVNERHLEDVTTACGSDYILDHGEAVSYEDKRAELEANGFTVGDRNPNLNTNYQGAFMIVEHIGEWDGATTGDGSDGPWCIVGDDLDELIDEAYDVHKGFTFN